MNDVMRSERPTWRHHQLNCCVAGMIDNGVVDQLKRKVLRQCVLGRSVLDQDAIHGGVLQTVLANAGNTVIFGQLKAS